jgi:hypothetical protein
MFEKQKLNDVFTPGGQPSVTYVTRAELGIEESLKKAISQRSIIVSLTGPTKSGKTVLCRKVLENFEYVWIEGGQIKTDSDLWGKVCYELNYPEEIAKTSGGGSEATFSLSGGIEHGLPANKASVMMTLGGSRLKSSEVSRKYRIDSMHTALQHLIKNEVGLVIDDFHYIPDEARSSVVKALKGAVFQGLKIVLLSTPHRAFEAIKAEAEVTGRFKHVTLPTWTEVDLRKIATTGFSALNVKCNSGTVQIFAKESQGSPLLMQQFCWNICYGSGISESSLFPQKINDDFDVAGIFNEVAQDAGLPIYEKLSRGPQSRTSRIMRPLATGGEVDIYQAISPRRSSGCATIIQPKGL